MKLTWPYIAGFFDGEGTIFMRQGSDMIQPIAAIYQGGPNGKRLLEEMQEWMRLYGVKARGPIAMRSGHGKAVHMLRMEGRQAVGQFVINALPYLRIKKTQSQDILRFIRMYKRRDGRKDRFKA